MGQSPLLSWYLKLARSNTTTVPNKSTFSPGPAFFTMYKTWPEVSCNFRSISGCPPRSQRWVLFRFLLEIVFSAKRKQLFQRNGKLRSSAATTSRVKLPPTAARNAEQNPSPGKIPIMKRLRLTAIKRTCGDLPLLLCLAKHARSGHEVILPLTGFSTSHGQPLKRSAVAARYSSGSTISWQAVTFVQVNGQPQFHGPDSAGWSFASYPRSNNPRMHNGYPFAPFNLVI